MAPEPTPAIVRNFGQNDRHTNVISTPYDSVSFSPGFGDSGYKLQVVEHDCPNCDFDRMVRRWDVSPETHDEARYWCLYPNCPHYLSDEFRFAFEGRKHDGRQPAIFDGVDA